MAIPAEAKVFERTVGVVVLLQSLLVAAAALATFRNPRRASLMYTCLPGRNESAEPPVADPVFVLSIAPLQAAVALLMVGVGWNLVRGVCPPGQGLCLAAFALMELAFAAARLRVNALRGVVPWWRLPGTDVVVTTRALVTSVVLGAVYAATAAWCLRS